MLLALIDSVIISAGIPEFGEAVDLIHNHHRRRYMWALSQELWIRLSRPLLRLFKTKILMEVEAVLQAVIIHGKAWMILL